MSAEFRNMLREQPLELLRKYAIHPADNIQGYKGIQTDTKNATNRSGAQVTVGFSNVVAGRKVAFVDLNKRNCGAYDQTGNEGGNCVDIIGQFDFRNHWIPVFFLPWDESRAIVKMTIPRKGEFSSEATALDPDIFFTAAINGCSVFIQGTPERPTVYHAGGDTGRGKDMAAGAGFWREMLINFSDTGLGHIRSEVNKMDYIKNPNVTRNDGSSTTAHAKAYKEFLENAHRSVMRVQAVLPWGCVMGIRTGNAWKFYLQENATVQFMTFTKKHRWSKKNYATSQLMARPMAVREIYPNSTGIADMTPALPFRISTN